MATLIVSFGWHSDVLKPAECMLILRKFRASCSLVDSAFVAAFHSLPPEFYVVA